MIVSSLKDFFFPVPSFFAGKRGSLLDWTLWHFKKCDVHCFCQFLWYACLLAMYFLFILPCCCITWVNSPWLHDYCIWILSSFSFPSIVCDLRCDTLVRFGESSLLELFVGFVAYPGHAFHVVYIKWYKARFPLLNWKEDMGTSNHSLLLITQHLKVARGHYSVCF